MRKIRKWWLLIIIAYKEIYEKIKKTKHILIMIHNRNLIEFINTVAEL